MPQRRLKKLCIREFFINIDGIKLANIPKGIKGERNLPKPNARPKSAPSNKFCAFKAMYANTPTTGRHGIKLIVKARIIGPFNLSSINWRLKNRHRPSPYPCPKIIKRPIVQIMNPPPKKRKGLYSLSQATKKLPKSPLKSPKKIKINKRVKEKINIATNPSFQLLRVAAM